MSMSAADWTRILRRDAGNTYVLDATKAREVNPTAPRVLPNGTALLIPRDVGGPKTRRTTEEYTNFVASRSTDFILMSQGSQAPGENGLNTGAVKKTLNRICNNGSGCAPTILPVKMPGSLVGTTGQRLRLN
jgi:hypothetical protein